jgi:hypothetical protein
MDTDESGFAVSLPSNFLAGHGLCAAHLGLEGRPPWPEPAHGPPTRGLVGSDFLVLGLGVRQSETWGRLLLLLLLLRRLLYQGTHFNWAR